MRREFRFPDRDRETILSILPTFKTVWKGIKAGAGTSAKWPSCITLSDEPLTHTPSGWDNVRYVTVDLKTGLVLDIKTDLEKTKPLWPSPGAGLATCVVNSYYQTCSMSLETNPGDLKGA